jgi:hypothetical protein
MSPSRSIPVFSITLQEAPLRTSAVAQIHSSDRFSNPNSRMRLRASVANPFPQ